MLKLILSSAEQGKATMSSVFNIQTTTEIELAKAHEQPFVAIISLKSSVALISYFFVIFRDAIA